MFTISRKGLRAACVLIAALVVSVSAEAATINFGADTWRLAENAGSFSIPGVTATAGPAGAKLSWTSGLGLGVNHVGQGVSFDDESPDQIDLVEVLTISFAGPSVIDSFTVSNLFKEKACHNCDQYREMGRYRIDGGDWVWFTAGNAGNGRLTVDLGGVSASVIAFSADPANALYDYSLLSIDAAVGADDTVVKDVAEPTSMVLAGAALLIGAGRLRRRK